MSDLTRFRDHCRERAERPLPDDAPSWQALWTMLADEVDRYLDQTLAHGADTEPMWPDD